MKIGKKAPRIRLTQKEYEVVMNMREGLAVVTDTAPNDYHGDPLILSAWDEQGKMMDIDAYCRHYNLPRESVSSYKLVSHTGTPFYNIVFREEFSNTLDVDHIRDVLKSEIKKTYTYKPSLYLNEAEAVLKISDLHFGAFIRNLLLTDDFDSNILHESLLECVSVVNEMNFKKVHVHINGDLIESFSGLNHVNSWMSMDKDQIGANVVKLCAKMLDDVFKKVKNLGDIKIVAGNHDRTSKANDEDVKGGAAELIAWGLELMGYEVDFHPMIITHLVEGVNHINLHGHFGISKRSTEEILWKYGKKGVFNFIFEGHLHSVIEKLSVNKMSSFKTTRDDGIDKRRVHLPSFFTGNYYSETLGFDANAGYMVVWDNGKGKPQVFNGSV